jgi:hypothetical protein
VLVIGGTAAERGQLTAVRGAIENALRKAGWSWPARPPSPREADSLLKCDDSRSPWTCIPATISGLHAGDVERVFVLSDRRRALPLARPGRLGDVRRRRSTQLVRGLERTL